MAKMKALQPKMLEIREQYAEDKMKQQQAMMELYKKEKINPAAGCLPILVQIPVFYALYKVLYVTIEMRQAPFFGWIHDLAAPDPTSILNLFGLIPWDPMLYLHTPVLGTLIHFLSIGVWPLIMGFTMWAQMRLNPTPPDPVQAKMFAIMPFVFTFMLGTMPAGLVIYWAWNNTLSIAQQKYIMYSQDKAKAKRQAKA
jgi:YidC/Oxa1 family membrane protein insertase